MHCRHHSSTENTIALPADHTPPHLLWPTSLSHTHTQVVNGPKHPGAVGPAPAKYVPPPPEVPPELAGVPLKGWRDVYVAEGPEAWAKAVRQHKGVLLTDTTM